MSRAAEETSTSSRKANRGILHQKDFKATNLQHSSRKRERERASNILRHYLQLKKKKFYTIKSIEKRR